MPLLHGKQLGKYRIKKRVGAGSMADVYLAYQPGLDRDVALKIINPQLADNPHFLDRFQNEAKIVAGLQHPNIVPVYDFDMQDNTFYMVMQFVAGTNLNQHLLELHRQGQTMPPADVLRLFKPVLQAVDYAHRQGVAHLDLKPANVLLTPDMQPILVDFGLSQMVGAGELSGQNMIVGTPAYMSPEQGAGSPGDTRSDIYALGVMLYEMVTGAPPFTADTAISLILKHLDDPLPPPRAVNPAVPPAIEQIIQRAMEKQPDRRYQTAQAMLAALEAVSPAELSTGDASSPLPDDRPPYRGLRTFEPQDAEFYFGREAQVQQLVD
ncbi:MAG: serine/threonine protein kinase, partial [Chloroflexi bacterium]